MSSKRFFQSEFDLGSNSKRQKTDQPGNNEEFKLPPIKKCMKSKNSLVTSFTKTFDFQIQSQVHLEVNHHHQKFRYHRIMTTCGAMLILTMI